MVEKWPKFWVETRTEVWIVVGDVEHSRIQLQLTPQWAPHWPPPLFEEFLIPMKEWQEGIFRFVQVYLLLKQVSHLNSVHTLLVLIRTFLRLHVVIFCSSRYRSDRVALVRGSGEEELGKPDIDVVVVPGREPVKIGFHQWQAPRLNCHPAVGCKAEVM